MWIQYVKDATTSHILLKCIGITFFISLFFIAYFHVLNHPAFPITIIPYTYLDRLISFQPLTLPVYLSLWVYVVIPPVLMTSKYELYAFTLSMALMSIAALTIFYFWPTAIPASEIDWRLHPSIRFLKDVDAAGNACPSMHVATALFSGIWLDYLFRKMKVPHWLKAINIVWCVGIIYSTLATRQHVALDVFGGLILGYVSIFFVSITYWNRTKT